MIITRLIHTCKHRLPMKKVIIILAFVVISCQLTYCQVTRIELMKNQEISNFAYRISFYKYVMLGDELSVSVFFLSNPPGSGKREGTGIISHDIGLLVSESGDFPEYHLFLVKDLYHPELLNLSAENIKQTTIGFSYLDLKDLKKELLLKVSLKGLEIIKE